MLEKYHKRQRNRIKPSPRRRTWPTARHLPYGITRTVLPTTRHKWTRPALTPASKLVLDLITPDGWKAELGALPTELSWLHTTPKGASGHWPAWFALHACKMIVLAILKKSPLQRTSNTWLGPTRWVRRRCFILWWRRCGSCYRPDFQRDCGAVVQHLYIVLLVSRLADVTYVPKWMYRNGPYSNRSVYRSRMTLCSNPKWSCTDLALPQ